MKDAIRYVVTVKAVVQRVEPGGRKWERVSADADSPYAYTPAIETTVQREVQVYEQQLDSLDMPALVAVLNGLQPKPQPIEYGASAGRDAQSRSRNDKTTHVQG